MRCRSAWRWIASRLGSSWTERFLGIPQERVLGRHVTEVIGNTRMHIVVKTGELDEIGDPPLEMQAKLLCVLEGREVERLGGIKTVGVDFRLIAATNADPEELVKEGRLRWGAADH